jgi:hypothetical protein
METATAIAAVSQPPDKPRRGPGFPNGVSGNPRGRAAIRERAAELYAIMAPDFGEMSAVDTVLLRQACTLLARSERIHRHRDIDVALRMSGEARRLLQALRRRIPERAAPAETPLDQHLRTHYAVAPSEDDAEREPAGSLPAEGETRDASEALDGSGEAQGASGRQTPAGDETLTRGRPKGSAALPDGGGEAA